MLGRQSSLNQYQQTQFQTADRGTILLLMFDGALKFLTLAESSLAEENVARFGHNLGRAQAVIAELLHTLDHKAGGEIAVNLERLYRFMLEHLVEANIQKSAKHVVDVKRILGIIASAYREILANGLPRVDDLDAA
jgi:flagellar secretion chaperone FliS